MDPKLLCFAFLLESGFTHHELKELLFQNTFLSSESLWDKVRGGDLEYLSEARREKVQEKIKKVDTEKIEAYLTQNHIQIIPLYHESYPEKLRNILHAPAFLYVRGTLRTLPLIGVVGSRKHTHYSEKVLRSILPDLIASGIGVVSGGAIGVDALGHSITLEHSGYTIAVLGTGIDQPYPQSNTPLFRKIIEKGGAIISHFPLGTLPEAYNFPMRNEIVAGMSRGVLIPEASLSSGTLITAQLALEHGREVFVVPGDIDRSTSEGTNMLITTGQGKCVRNSYDILEDYFETVAVGESMNPIVKIPRTFNTEGEKQVFEAIERGHDTIDALITFLKQNMSEILHSLALLEIDGSIALKPTGNYVIL